MFASDMLGTYKKLVFEVLKAGDSELSDQKFNELWNGYVTQMGKMSKWIINKKYVNEILRPLIDDMLPNAISDAFLKGLNKNAGGTTKKDVNRIDLSLESKQEVSKVETSSEHTKGETTDAKPVNNSDSVNQKAAEEAERKRKDEEAARKAAEETAARKAAEEEVARKAAEEEAARKVAEEEAARKAAEEEAARKAAEEEAIKKIEAYHDLRLVKAFKNMMKNDAYPKKDVIKWFEGLVECFTISKNYFEQYQKDHKFKSLRDVLEAMWRGYMGWSLFSKEKSDTDVQEFGHAADFYSSLEPFLGQAGSRDAYGERYEYPTHNMLERLKKCCSQLKIEFSGVKTHPILKYVSKVYLEFITQLSDELEKQLKEKPAKTEEQEKEKLRKIEEAYPKEQRYIPYKAPDKKAKGFGSSAGLMLWWDRKNKMKVLLKYGSHVSIERRKNFVKRVKEGEYKHIPKVDWFEDDEGKFVFVIEYVSGAIPIFNYADTLKYDRKGLLNLCSQFLEASKEANELDCFPENKGEHFLVDKNGTVKFIDVDDGGDTSSEYVAEKIGDILKVNASMKSEFDLEYGKEKHGWTSKDKEYFLNGWRTLKQIEDRGLGEIQNVINKMMKSK